MASGSAPERFKSRRWPTTAVLAAIFGSGCTPRYTVIPADREVVPVKALRAGEQRTENGERIAPAGRRIYVEAEEGATGWYVPDATMIELLEAE